MKKKIIIATFLALFAVIFALFFPIQREKSGYRVSRIADGDSFTLVREGRETEVRLYGIDAPEQAQPFYRKAETFTRKMLQKGRIELKEVDRDRYGRTVAWVYVDSQCLNKELVRHGLAWHYKHHSKDLHLARLEDSARNVKAGLWSDPLSIPPWEYRKRKGKN